MRFGSESLRLALCCKSARKTKLGVGHPSAAAVLLLAMARMPPRSVPALTDCSEKIVK